jgi:hypothetical protein
VQLTGFELGYNLRALSPFWSDDKHDIELCEAGGSAAMMRVIKSV